MAAFLANVGVNAGHAACSPLFDDGSFQLLPIPEREPWRPPMIRFQDLSHLHAYAPASWRIHAVHLDPDLTSDIPTYGDNCRRAGRAFNLRRAQHGDHIYFLARLRPAGRPPQFSLVGCLEIEDVIADVAGDPGPGWWDANAHVRRARATGVWDCFWVFRGGPTSRLFKCAVPFARTAAAAVFGDDWSWPRHRSDLQTIGSHTRAVRRVEGIGEKWLRTICQS